MIPLPEIPKTIEKKDNKATIEIKPFYPGYGTTIGNSYRRILLSSLEGAAITKVKIKGVNHEFSTMSGILEDVVTLLLNLKKLRFRNYSDQSQSITLSAKGEKEVKAKDFKLGSELKLANPDSYIATLTSKNSSLQMEATVEKGVGFVFAEDKKEEEKEDEEVEKLNIDANFSPVKKVSFGVENVRVGKRTDFEKLNLTIETDGIVTPEEAFSQATEILNEHISIFSKFNPEEEISSKESKQKQTEKSKKSSKEKSEGTSEENKEVKKTKIKDMDISEKTKNILTEASIKSIGGLIKKTEKDLLGLEGFGKKSLEEVEKILKKKGLQLKG